MSWFLAGKEVVKDLVTFFLPSPALLPTLASRAERTALPAPIPVPKIEEKPQTLLVSGSGFLHQDVLYASRTRVKVWQRPLVAEDGVVGYLNYGQPVFLIDYQGRFAQVRFGDLLGFVLKDDLEKLRDALYPAFFDGEIYTANHPDTKKLRRLINDEFAYEELFAPLQPSEFVMYRLAENKLSIPWGQERPRTVGVWHNLLKGRIGVNISITPKTGSLIEYQKDDGTGFVGYIKAVLVDNSLVLEGVGRVIDGEYREETIAPSVWREWRPVFIAIS